MNAKALQSKFESFKDNPLLGLREFASSPVYYFEPEFQTVASSVSRHQIMPLHKFWFCYLSFNSILPPITNFVAIEGDVVLTFGDVQQAEIDPLFEDSGFSCITAFNFRTDEILHGHPLAVAETRPEIDLCIDILQATNTGKPLRRPDRASPIGQINRAIERRWQIMRRTLSNGRRLVVQPDVRLAVGTVN